MIDTSTGGLPLSQSPRSLTPTLICDGPISRSTTRRSLPVHRDRSGRSRQPELPYPDDVPQIAYSHSPVIETALGMEFVASSLDAAQALEIRDRLREASPRVELHPALPPRSPLGLSGILFGLSVGSHPNERSVIAPRTYGSSMEPGPRRRPTVTGARGRLEYLLMAERPDENSAARTSLATMNAILNAVIDDEQPTPQLFAADDGAVTCEWLVGGSHLMVTAEADGTVCWCSDPVDGMAAAELESPATDAAAEEMAREFRTRLNGLAKNARRGTPLSDPADELTISDDDSPLRRGPQDPGFVVWDEHTGAERPSTGSFRIVANGVRCTCCLH